MLLYKFRPINEFSINLVKNGDLWFSRMSDLNDPFEGDFTFSQKYINENFIRHSTLPETGNFEYHKTMMKAFRELRRNHLFILSLTENYMDNVMWSHYAENHSGIVIGIEFDDICDNQFLNMEIEPIKRQDSYIHDVSYDSSPVVIDDNELEEYRKIFIRKSEQWKYEKEKRIAFRNDDLNGPGFVAKIDPKRIKEVHFGARTTKDSMDHFIQKVGVREDLMYNKMGFIHGYFKLTSFPI